MSSKAFLAGLVTVLSVVAVRLAAQVILLDAAFDRGSIFPPLGFTAADVKKADVILIGHGHADHMSDAASIAVRTGAIVAAPVLRR